MARHRRRGLHRLELRASAPARERADAQVVNVDLLTYAGNLENLADVEERPALRASSAGDVADPAGVDGAVGAQRSTSIVHFAAETHVDRSIDDADAVPADERRRHAGAARRGARRRRRRASSDRAPTRSTARSSSTTRSFTEDDAAAPEHARTRRASARRDLLVRAAVHTHGLHWRRHALLEQLRAVPVPGEVPPADDHQRARATSRCRSTATACSVRDWIHVDDHNRAAILAAPSAARVGRGLQRRRRGRRADEPRRPAASSSTSAGKPQSLDPPRASDRPGVTTAATRSTVRARRRRSAWSPTIGFRRMAARHGRLVPRQPRVVGTREVGAYRAYYESDVRRARSRRAAQGRADLRDGMSAARPRTRNAARRRGAVGNGPPSSSTADLDIRLRFLSIGIEETVTEASESAAGASGVGVAAAVRAARARRRSSCLGDGPVAARRGRDVRGARTDGARARRRWASAATALVHGRLRARAIDRLAARCTFVHDAAGAKVLEEESVSGSGWTSAALTIPSASGSSGLCRGPQAAQGGTTLRRVTC